MKKTLIIMAIASFMLLTGCQNKRTALLNIDNKVLFMVASDFEDIDTDMWDVFSEEEKARDLADLIDYSLRKDFSPAEELVFKVDEMEYIGEEQYKIRFVFDSILSMKSLRGDKKRIDIEFHFIVNTVGDAVSMGATERKYCHLKWNPEKSIHRGLYDRLSMPTKECKYYYWLWFDADSLTIIPCE